MKKSEAKLESEEKLIEAFTEDFGRTVSEYYQDDSAYVILQRSILEELPVESQRKFVAIIEEVNNTFDLSDMPEKFVVMPRGKNNNSKKGTCAVADPYRDKCPPKYRKR